MFKFIPSKHDEKLIQVHFDCNVASNEEAPAIIIAHPYGPLGGNINNNVVISIQRHFVSRGYITACINFRGCGKSQGRTSWTGIPEQHDYQSVLEYLTTNHQALAYPKPSKFILCGYSYGAMIANSIECTNLPCAYLLISLPLGVMWALATTKQHVFKKQRAQPTLCIYGDRDQFTGTSRFLNWCRGFTNITNHCVQGADHFWFDYEQELLDHVENWRLALSL